MIDLMITLNVVEFSAQLIKRLVYVSVYFLTVVCHVLWALLLFRRVIILIYLLFTVLYQTIFVF